MPGSKVGRVTAVGWQVTLCDAISQVISRVHKRLVSNETCLTNWCLLYFTLLYPPVVWEGHPMSTFTEVMTKNRVYHFFPEHCVQRWGLLMWEIGRRLGHYGDHPCPRVADRGTPSRVNNTVAPDTEGAANKQCQGEGKRWSQYVITNCEEGKGKPPRLFPKTGYPWGYPEPALQQKTKERERLCTARLNSWRQGLKALMILSRPQVPVRGDEVQDEPVDQSRPTRHGLQSQTAPAHRSDTHTHTQPFYCFSGVCPGQPAWAGTRKVKPGRLKPIWIYRSKR